jgi:hypothetical protein
MEACGEYRTETIMLALTWIMVRHATPGLQGVDVVVQGVGRFYRRLPLPPLHSKLFYYNLLDHLHFKNKNITILSISQKIIFYAENFHKKQGNKMFSQRFKKKDVAAFLFSDPFSIHREKRFC